MGRKQGEAVELFLEELNRIREPKLKLERCLNFLERYAAIADPGIMEIADRATILASKADDADAAGKILYFRGLAMLALHKDVQGRAPSNEGDMKAAIRQLEDAYHFFADRSRHTSRDTYDRAEEKKGHGGSRGGNNGKIKPEENGSSKTPEQAASIVRSALALGQAYAQEGKPAESLRWQMIALLTGQLASFHDGSSESPSLPVASAHEAIGATYQSLGDHHTAQKHFEQCRAIREELHDEEGTARALSALAATYLGLENRDNAEELYRRSHDIYAGLGRQYQTAITMGRLAHVRMESVDASSRGHRSERQSHILEDANDLAIRADTILQEIAAGLDTLEAKAAIGDIYEQQVQVKITLGRIAELQGSTDKALSFYSQAYTITEEHCSPRLFLPVLLHKGRVYRRCNEIDEFTRTFDNAIEIARAIGDRHLEYQFHEELANLYESMGWWREALREHKLFAKIRHDIAGERARIAAEVQRIKLETALKEREAELLRERNALLNSYIRHLEAGTVGREKGTIDTLPKQWVFYQEELDRKHPEFLERLRKRAPDLTRAEEEICAMIRLRYANHEIRRIRNVHTGLDAQRLRIRRKLGLRRSKRTLEEEIWSI